MLTSSPQEHVLLAGRVGSQIVGSPERVRDGLRELIERAEAGEVVLTTAVYAHAERVRSYELLAEVTGLEPLAVVAPASGAQA